MAGRKTKYTPETVENITNALKLGMTRRDACVHGGIDDATFCRWMNDKSEFRETVEKAELQSKMSRVARITKAGTNGTWQADAWMLERKYADEFAQRFYFKVAPEDAALLKKHGLTPAEAWAQMMQEFANADTE